MIRKVLDWVGYVGLAAVVAGAVLPFVRPGLAQ